MVAASEFLDRTRVEIKLGEFGIAPATALGDVSLQLRTQEYRRLTAARMVALEKADILAKLPAGDYHVSRKYDGEFNCLVFDGEQAVLVNPGGTVRLGLPLLAEAKKLLGKAQVKQALIAGELYVNKDGGRERVHDVSGIARQPSSQAELDSLRFAVFDLIEVDRQAPLEGLMPYGETWKRIRQLFEKGLRVHPVEAVICKSTQEVNAKFGEWVESGGAEGLVVRNDAAGVYKVKPRHSIDACVVGFTEGIEDRTGMIHDLLLALMRGDGTFHLLGRVGGGFTEQQRRDMLSDLKDLAVKSDYAEVNPDHVAYQMVEPKWIAEISCLDFINQTTRGGTIDRMVLSYDTSEPQARYEPVRRLPLASPISPQFIRLREDKQVTPVDLRLQQVADLVEVPLTDRDARQLALPASTILRRQVWTKAMKGQTMVRKLLMWKTNKEAVSDRFPAFVVHLTDFSPNRKTPLDREVRVSSSREQIDELWTQLETENITKGWVAAV